MQSVFKPLKWLTFGVLAGLGLWIAYPVMWRVLAVVLLGWGARRLYAEQGPAVEPAEDQTQQPLRFSDVQPGQLGQVDQAEVERMMLAPFVPIIKAIILACIVGMCAMWLAQ